MTPDPDAVASLWPPVSQNQALSPRPARTLLLLRRPYDPLGGAAALAPAAELARVDAQLRAYAAAA